MKHLLLLAALCCLVFTSSLQAQDLKADMQTYANAWAAAHNRGDAPALAAMHADKVVFVNPNGTTATQTRQEIEADFVKSFSVSDNKMEIVVSAAEPQPGDKARITGSYSGSVTDKKTGEKIVYAGTFDHLAVKENGQWKVFQMKSVPK